MEDQKQILENLKARFHRNLQLLNQKKTTRWKKNENLEIHATDIFAQCLRYLFIHNAETNQSTPSSNSLPLPTLLTFELGRRIEDMVRELLEGQDAPAMSIHLSGKYRDIILIGSPDILVDDIIIECKSINKKSFEVLISPIQKHVAQLSFYLFLAKELGLPLKHGVLVYVPKEQTNEVVKMFYVELSDYYNKYFTKLIEYFEYCAKNNKLPDRVCVDENSPLAQKCIYRNICFNGGEEWIKNK